MRVNFEKKKIRSDLEKNQDFFNSKELSEVKLKNLKDMSHLEELCQGRELVLIDTNLLSFDRSNKFLHEIYDCGDILNFDKDHINDILCFISNSTELLRKNNNLIVTQGLIEETDYLRDIINGKLRYYEKRKNNKNKRFKKIHSRDKKIDHNKKRKIDSYNKIADLIDDGNDFSCLDTLKDFSNSLHTLIRVANNKVVTEYEDFKKVFSRLKYFSQNYPIKSIKNDPYKKTEDNNNDEKLVACAYCISCQKPLHLVSKDCDIFKLCNFLWDKIDKNQDDVAFPKFPVHLHTYCPGHTGLVHRVSYISPR
jgi:hypothetical protein